MTLDVVAADGFGTGVSLDSGRPENVTVTGSTFRDNVAGIGSTEDVDGLTITGTTFTENSEGIGLGGGLENRTVTDNAFEINNCDMAEGLDDNDEGTYVPDYDDVATCTDPTLQDIQEAKAFDPSAVLSDDGDGRALVAEPADENTTTGPSPSPTPDFAPPVRTPAPAGPTVERERGPAGAVVDGVEAETSVSVPEVAPSDPDVPPSEEEVERRRAVTRQFVDQVLAAVPEDERGVSVADTDDGAAIVGLLADRNDDTQSRPVPPTAVAAVSAGDVRLLAAVTDRRGNPRDRAADGALRGAPGGDAAVRGFGLPAEADGQIQVRSTARVLGVVSTDDAGRLASQVELPADLPPGDHTLVITVGGTTTSVGISVEADFDDVSTGSVHVDAIEELAEDSVFQGQPDGTFGPAQGLLRGQMATVLARLLNLDIDEDAAVPFVDVADDATHAGAIAAIADEGFTEGCDNDGRFCPDTAVTRGQLAAFLARAYDLPEVDADPFTDIATVMLADEIRAAAAAGVIWPSPGVTDSAPVHRVTHRHSCIRHRGVAAGYGCTRRDGWPSGGGRLGERVLATDT